MRLELAYKEINSIRKKLTPEELEIFNIIHLSCGRRIENEILIQDILLNSDTDADKILDIAKIILD